MLSKLWNAIFLVGLAAAVFAFLTGRDISGAPTSVQAAECSDIAAKFIGSEVTLDYSLRKIQRVDRMEVLSQTETVLICRGLAYLEGSPSTFMRLSATEQADGQLYAEIDQAYPEDYDCDLLAEEIIMKFHREILGDYGTITSISEGLPDMTQPLLHCNGTAKFSNGESLPLTYAYDGTQFTFGQ